MALQKQKIQFFEAILKDYFQKSGRRELPWRKRDISPYEVWVSEIMLQQTQVSRVVDYYTKFLKRYPTVSHLARTSWEEFLPYYEGLGYYARGRNMLKAAQIIQEEYQGVFPRNKEKLIRIPGIGPYTAAAIMSFGYGDRHLAWDTNLRRVIGRFFYGAKNTPIETEKLEEAFTLPRRKLNAAVMDFGSSICTARPKCANCPLQRKCVYFQTSGIKEAVTRKEKSAFALQEAQVILFLHENHKKYYSSRRKKFLPFFLTSARNSRSAIKDFFLQEYGLQVSVRPPHKRLLLKGVPTMLVNAQILSGKPDFATFPKQAVAEYTKDNF